MEIVLAAVIAAVVGAAAAMLVTQRARAQLAPVRSAGGGASAHSAESPAEVTAASATEASTVAARPTSASSGRGVAGGTSRDRPPAPGGTPRAQTSSRTTATDAQSAPPSPDSTADAALELRERRAEIARTEERLLAKEQSLDTRLAEVSRREQSLDDRARNLDRDLRNLKEAKRGHVRELERIARLSAGQAKQILLREIEDDLKHERARRIRQAEEQARRDAERRARSILSACMQRVASGHAAETTVSVVTLSSDELKGRIIGREGRNIRALENLTGIDFIIDDTPETVVLSGFDGVRREIARVTLEKLLQDGRIHPARIEEAYYQSRSEIENRLVEIGEQAALEAAVGTVSPELVKLLGRLHYRTSYGQNVLAHSIECAHLAAMISDELGASGKTARRAALLHDIGKAVSHEVEGPHALVGGQLARRHKESEAVAHAMEAHHNEVEMQTIEAVVVQVADALSGARPGARGDSLEQYTKRLRDLEEVAGRHPGVDRVYAMQAGREVRVIVRPEDVDDDTAAILSHEIARDVERELEYGGQIKVTVIRESRTVDYAK